MTSLFELFKVGVGPSSSHTVGPMRAALSFVSDLRRANLLDRTCRLRTDLYGSLALTGIGHGTNRAVLLGLTGATPDTLTPEQSTETMRAAQAGVLRLHGLWQVDFQEERDLIFHRKQMYPDPDRTTHPNGLRFTAYQENGLILATEVYYSIGGGFVVTDEHFSGRERATPQSSRVVPYPFRSAQELLQIAQRQALSIAEIMLHNEVALLSDASIHRPALVMSATPLEQVRQGILALAGVMLECINQGMATEGVLPGGLNVRRRAAKLTARLREKGSADPLAPLDWVTVFAMAVNEENAAGGRVVTAPTNGAAGVVPAIARYYLNFLPGADTEGLLRYLLTAAAIGILYKENASISGAEVGCQGEVGVACSMAAGGLVAAQGGSNAQVEHAAEIAMEHNLGMTCDPIGGLVQIPCIERNAMGAVKAVNAARMAMNETEGHKVSLDQVIRTMYLTGLDMQSRYKETSLAGLALNVIEC